VCGSSGQLAIGRMLEALEGGARGVDLPGCCPGLEGVGSLYEERLRGSSGGLYLNWSEGG